ncbi:MAG TPA: hypothetical protein VGB42_01240 [Candidatus Thermoplasmatota archaeon]
MARPLRNEITFFGHIIQGNRITIKADDMEVLAPDEDEIFEITVRRVSPLPAFAELELSAFAQSCVDAIASEAGIKDAQVLFTMFCRKWDVDARTMQKRDLSPAFLQDMKQAVVALTRDAKLAELIELKLQRLS